MSTHPNAILLLALTPDDLARRTWRGILSDCGVEYEGDNTDDIKITAADNIAQKYHHFVMESDYSKSLQISGQEGDIMVFSFITYGFGERIEWDKLQAQKDALEAWAKDICAKHNCRYKIYITANYW